MLAHALNTLGPVDAIDLDPGDVTLGALLLDPRGNIEDADEAACAVLRRARAEIVGAALVDLLTEGTGTEVARIATSGAPGTISAPLRASGRRVYFHFSSLSPAARAPTSRLCALASVDSWAMDAKARALVQLRMTVDAVVAGLAHEARNPLAAILSLTEAALAQEPASSRTAQTLRSIPFMVSRIESLIAQSQEYSRPKAPAPGWCSVDALIEAALALGGGIDKGPRIDRQVPPTLPEVYVDCEQVERILLNLIENACRGAKEAVLIRARAAAEAPGTVWVEVIDDGPGVQPDIRDRLFEPFFSTRPKGVGLGLAIARDLARLNGGEVTLASPGPKDTTFRVELPSVATPLGAGAR